MAVSGPSLGPDAAAAACLPPAAAAVPPGCMCTALDAANGSCSKPPPAAAAGAAPKGSNPGAAAAADDDGGATGTGAAADAEGMLQKSSSGSGALPLLPEAGPEDIRLRPDAAVVVVVGSGPSSELMSMGCFCVIAATHNHNTATA